MFLAVVFFVFSVFAIGIFERIIFFAIFHLLLPELLLVLVHDI